VSKNVKAISVALALASVSYLQFSETKTHRAPVFVRACW
jgi:hypothetical protein